MQIILNQVGHQYQREWILKEIDYQFDNSTITGVKGANGSGKSTLLSLISTILQPTEGSLTYSISGQDQSIDQVRTQIAHVAPSIDLIPQLSLKDTLDFHLTYSPLLTGISEQDLLNITWLNDKQHLKISELSSGMRQRFKLALAFCCQNQLLLLDEPTSNLDEQGLAFFDDLMKNYRNNRTVIIASNELRDFNHCGEVLDINQWKPAISHA